MKNFLTIITIASLMACMLTFGLFGIASAHTAQPAKPAAFCQIATRRYVQARLTGNRLLIRLTHQSLLTCEANLALSNSGGFGLGLGGLGLGGGFILPGLGLGDFGLGGEFGDHLGDRFGSADGLCPVAGYSLDEIVGPPIPVYECFLNGDNINPVCPGGYHLVQTALPPNAVWTCEL